MISATLYCVADIKSLFFSYLQFAVKPNSVNKALMSINTAESPSDVKTNVCMLESTYWIEATSGKRG